MLPQPPPSIPSTYPISQSIPRLLEYFNKVTGYYFYIASYELYVIGEKWRGRSVLLLRCWRSRQQPHKQTFLAGTVA